LSYLAASQETDDVDEALMILTRHRDAVHSQLTTDHPSRILEKYEWVADYHNAYCDVFFAPWPELQLLDRDERRAFHPYVPRTGSGP
jgi:hypothetical protein